jgi:hypothetical protein
MYSHKIGELVFKLTHITVTTTVTKGNACSIIFVTRVWKKSQEPEKMMGSPGLLQKFRSMGTCTCCLYFKFQTRQGLPGLNEKFSGLLNTANAWCSMALKISHFLSVLVQFSGCSQHFGT